MSLTIIADVKVEPKAITVIKRQMMTLVKKSSEEEGCVKYNLHQDDKDKNHFIFYEVWETKPLWKKHLSSKHVTSFVKDTKDDILDFKVYEMNKL